MMSSLPLSTGSGLAAAMAKTEMERLLECPVCTEIPVPPIYTCETGHSICKDCKPKLKQCAICKKPYTNSRNFVQEAMIQAAKFHCNLRPKGCTVTGTPDQLITHHRICKFRPVKCFLNGKDDCNGAVLCMSDYVNHLKNVHAVNSLSKGKDKQNTFTASFCFTEWDEEKVKDDWWWEPSLINSEGRWFLTRLTSPPGLLFFIRCMLIGEEIEAQNYAVNITIHNTSNPKIRRFSRTTVVESLRAVTENTDRLPPTVIQKDLMARLGTLTSYGRRNTEKKKKMDWTLNYKITKS